MKTINEWGPSKRYTSAHWMRVSHGDMYITLWLQRVSADVFQYKSIEHEEARPTENHTILPWQPLEGVTTLQEAQQVVKVLARLV